MAKPERHVFVCTQYRPPGHPRGSCNDKGCREVADEFFYQLQQRQCIGKVAVTTAGCIGPCGNGPNVLVYPDGVLYSGVGKEDVSAIFEQHLLGGMPVERLLAAGEVW